MQKADNFYYNLGYWFLLLVVLVFAGFYTSYFAVFFQPTAPIIHIHFILMVLWITMMDLSAHLHPGTGALFYCSPD